MVSFSINVNRPKQYQSHLYYAFMRVSTVLEIALTHIISYKLQSMIHRYTQGDLSCM